MSLRNNKRYSRLGYRLKRKQGGESQAREAVAIVRIAGRNAV